MDTRDVAIVVVDNLDPAIEVEEDMAVAVAVE